MDVVRRVYDGARAGQRIVANIYRPRTPAQSGQPLTLLLAHANGFHKELWEPTLERLFAHADDRWAIAEAIALDGYNHGDSAALNREFIIGETSSSWFLCARDILTVLRQLQSPHPIVGIGHSWGATSLLLAELISPQTFAALIATDPILYTAPEPNTEVVKMTNRRRAEWADEAAARKYFESHPFFSAWDSRILDRHIRHGLEPVNAGDGAPRPRLVLKCRPSCESAVYTGALHSSVFATRNLWRIQCPTAFLTGEKSVPTPPRHIAAITRDIPDCTRAVMPAAGHLLVHEAPDATADHYIEFLARFAPKMHGHKPKF
ncbi:hypothetical protein H4R18_002702 [Coemansia javaensis]|uniref:AB hydrolase-1 domain-containing protein n=1 Tax=Coemansia javaensis TaxID=2761396 RepID=A0A9W8HCA5_9FUNG|nr:hypothetical protein H4R18_002702 [Coemansia javaensis]